MALHPSLPAARRPRPGTAATAGVPRRQGPRGSGAGRLDGLDAARGLAILGMIVINVGPTDATSLAHRLYLLPYGRASVLFVVVAGVGIGLLAARSARVGGPRLDLAGVLWRAAVLGVGGLALQSLTDDIGVVLPLYGILFLLSPLLVRLPTRGLAALAAACLVAGPVLVVVHDLLAPTALTGGDPVQADDAPLDLLLGLLVAGRYPLVTWVVPFLVGLLLARTDLRARTVQLRLVLWGTAAAVAGLAASTLSRALLGTAADEGFPRLLTGVAHGQMPLWLVSSIGGAAAVVGLCLRVDALAPRLLRPLAAYGRLSLTVYVLHVLALVLVLPQPVTLAQGVATSAGLVVATALLPLLWARVGGPGPLERVLRPPWAVSRRSPRGPSSTVGPAA